ncbi:MerR family transcriptional regulator [Sciscionella marina]|uniref:MerR family transcriptional regulator n=1 Tax=Sciscionella marina TaxID=508770 RepID=UPI000A054B87|nr:MerR family transcriptional regulator [Sciscionella marina]
MSTVRIGAAAALYDLAPSTVRWWERQGVLGQPPRHGGVRRYRERDLRRLGLVYVCHVTGMMPLDKTAIVASGDADLATWRRTVREQVREVERGIDRMQAARKYLCHLLSCEDDDITECRYLDRELTAHTPRGRFPHTDLCTAAGIGHRDESSACCDENRCGDCRGPLTQTGRGRPRKYCSRSCQQRAYRTRTEPVPRP